MKKALAFLLAAVILALSLVSCDTGDGVPTGTQDTAPQNTAPQDTAPQDTAGDSAADTADTAPDTQELAEITADFELCEGVTVKTDRTLYVETGREKEAFIYCFDAIRATEGMFGDSLKFVFDGAEAVVSYDGEYFTFDTITSHGHTYDFREHDSVNFCADRIIAPTVQYLFYTGEDMFVYQCSYYETSAVFALVFTDGEITEISGSATEVFSDEAKNIEWYNESVTAFARDNDGTLTYVRVPRKYAPSQLSGYYFPYCMGLDEFCCEEGFVTLENGELKFTPEKKYTVSEVYDMEKDFAEWLDYVNGVEDFRYRDMLSGDRPTPASLDELFKYNTEHYERAE